MYHVADRSITVLGKLKNNIVDDSVTLEKSENSQNNAHLKIEFNYRIIDLCGKGGIKYCANVQIGYDTVNKLPSCGENVNS